MRVSVISWLRFLIFQQFNVFKLVSKNRSFQVLLHQSNQGSLQQLSRRDGSGSCSETFTLIWNNRLQTLSMEQMGRLRLVQCMQNYGGKEAPSRAGRWGWGKLNLESVLFPCRAGAVLLNPPWKVLGCIGWVCSSCCPSKVGLASETVSSELKDRVPVQVVHISSEEPLVLVLIDIGENKADLSGVGVTPVWSLWVGLSGCASCTSVKGALAQGTGIGVTWSLAIPWVKILHMKHGVCGVWEAALSASQVLCQWVRTKSFKPKQTSETLERFLQNVVRVHPCACFLQWWEPAGFLPSSSTWILDSSA